MPFFLYRCQSCKADLKRLFTAEKARRFDDPCPSCGGKLVQIMGTPGMNAKETLDEYRGKTADLDIKAKIAERSRAHFVEHELPRIIQKQGIEFAQRQGFVDAEGNPIK